MHPNDLLHSWASYQVFRLEGLGCSPSTILHLVGKGEWSPGQSYKSKYPRGAALPGFTAFERVERVLEGLRDGYRVVVAEIGVWFDPSRRRAGAKQARESGSSGVYAGDV